MDTGRIYLPSISRMLDVDRSKEEDTQLADDGLQITVASCSLPPGGYLLLTIYPHSSFFVLQAPSTSILLAPVR